MEDYEIKPDTKIGYIPITFLHIYDFIVCFNSNWYEDYLNS
jgi:hypothetical protein